MLLATKNTGAIGSFTTSGSTDTTPISNVELSTFDINWRANSQSAVGVPHSISFQVSNFGGTVGYVGIAGHTLGSSRYIVELYKTGGGDVLLGTYTPNNDDNRVIMFTFDELPSGTNFRLDLTPTFSIEDIFITHIAGGTTYDFDTKDYSGGFSLAELSIPKQSRTKINRQAAPTATIVQSSSIKLNLMISNFLKSNYTFEVIRAVDFWTENTFFIKSDDETNLGYLAYNFMSMPPKAHDETKALINLQYKYDAYNGIS